jgi:hypothetical protein
MLPISMVSCAFATTGKIEIANVRQINPLLIVVVLQSGSTRILHTAARKTSAWILSESHKNFPFEHHIKISQRIPFANHLRALQWHATTIRGSITITPRACAWRDHNRRRDHDRRNVSRCYISVRHTVAHTIAVGAAVKAEAAEASHLQNLWRRHLCRHDWKSLSLKRKN